MDERDAEPQDEVPRAWLEQQALLQAQEERRLEALADELARRRKRARFVRTVVGAGVAAAVMAAGYRADRVALPAATPLLLIVWFIAAFASARAVQGFLERRGLDGESDPRNVRERARRRRRQLRRRRTRP